MTYKRALKFAKPDIVCFLGDLLDEGSVATNDQFKNYVDRFNSIFHIDDNIKVYQMLYEINVMKEIINDSCPFSLFTFLATTTSVVRMANIYQIQTFVASKSNS